MRTLPLWKEPPRAAVEAEKPLFAPRGEGGLANKAAELPPDLEGRKRLGEETEELSRAIASCSRCGLWKGARKILGAEVAWRDPEFAAIARLGGEEAAAGVLEERKPEGALVLIGEGPGKEEEAVGRPWVGMSGKKLRRIVGDAWKGPVVLDNATRCRPPLTGLTDKHVESCRPYLAATLRELPTPARVVLLGRHAAYSVLGRGVSPLTNRRAWGWLYGWETPVPWFSVLHPAAALRNRFINRWFDEDFRWALKAMPPKQNLDAVGRIVETREDAEEAVAELSAAEWATFDVETCGRMHDPSFRLLALSACAKRSDSPWIWLPVALENAATSIALRWWLSNEAAKKIGANVKYDERSSLIELITRVRGVVGDVRLWRKLLDPEADGSLGKMVELVGMGGMKEEARDALEATIKQIKLGISAEKRIEKRDAADAEKMGRGEKIGKRAKPRPETKAALEALEKLDREMPDLAKIARDPDADPESWAYALVDPEILARYNGRDTVGTARVAERLERVFPTEPEIDRVRKLIVDPGGRALVRVEHWGVPIDSTSLATFEAHLDVKLAEAAAGFARFSEIPPNFNPASPDQVGELLFEKLKLPSVKLTKGGDDSTDNEVLEKLRKMHPIVPVLIDFRKYSKLQGTYGKGMRTHIRSDGRIHPSILLDGARSGRTSCSNPNLQNIPSEKNDAVNGKMARDVFCARDGWTLVSLDYSQLELRVAAMLSGDPLMLDVFKSGYDFHQKTAEMISEIVWGIPASAVTKEHRSYAKTVNFGIIYGKGAKTFAEEWGTSVDFAEKVIASILGRFRQLDKWLESQVRFAQREGYVWTEWQGERARRRPLYQVADEDDARASRARNGAKNTPIQGGASDFCIRSLATAVEWIEEDGLEDDVELILPVHDQLLFHCREAFADRVANVAREIMTGYDSKGVPIVVDEDRGQRWGSLEKPKMAA